MNNLASMLIDTTTLHRVWDSTIDFQSAMRKLFAHALRGEHMTFGGNEDYSFRVAVAAAVKATNNDDHQWLMDQVEGLAKFGAVMAAASVGIATDFATVEVPDNPRPYSLLTIWNEVRDEEAKRRKA